MNQIKLLVVDIDGTLVGEDTKVSEENKTALRRAEEAGIKVALATGRPFESCMKLADKLDLISPYHIISDGAWCGTKGGHAVFSAELDKRTVAEMVDFARSIELNMELYTLKHGYAEHQDWSDYVHRMCLGVGMVYGPFNNLWEKEPVLKIGCVAHDDDERASIFKFHRNFFGQVNFSPATAPCAPGTSFLNVLSKDVNKGRALRELAKVYNIDIENIAAIGDGSNDIALLQSAGFSAAMSNARSALKKVADLVVAPVDQNGVAQFINEYILKS